MKQLIQNFATQLQEAIQIGKNTPLNTKPSVSINNVVVCGLGGSGIGGTLLNNLLDQEIEIPLIVNKKYTSPNFANENTLVIISSYSGNTEETLQAFESARAKKCQIACVSSGGQVEKIAVENQFPFIKIPNGMPPRACLAYSFVQLFYILNHYNLINNSFEKGLKEAIDLLTTEDETIKTKAKDWANKMLNKIPILYSADNFEAVAIRWRQQINENGKMLCWHHAVPEMNHNELVGWRIKNDDFAVFFLRNETDLPKIQQRIDLNKEIISKYTPNIYELWSKGNSMIAKAMYLIYLGDWVSYYLSELRNVDATEVKIIDYLKGELAK